MAMKMVGGIHIRYFITGPTLPALRNSFCYSHPFAGGQGESRFYSGALCDH
jgi:hypothetical protein